MTDVTFSFTQDERFALAQAASAAATDAYCDERLHAAIALHRAAAKLWKMLHSDKAQRHHQLAQAIEAELAAIAAGDDQLAITLNLEILTAINKESETT
jgi:hypothetical protein